MERYAYKPVRTSGEFKSEFSRIKRIRHFYTAWEARYLAGDLHNLLEALDVMPEPPETKVKLLAAFFKADSNIVNKCDDSYGEMSMLYGRAGELFTKHAALCADQAMVAKLVLKTYSADTYSMCDFLLEKGCEGLPQKNLRVLAGAFWTAAEAAGKERKGHFFQGVKAMAEHLKDPELYERAFSAEYGGIIHDGHLPGVAQVYFNCGRPAQALAVLERIKPGISFRMDERDELLLNIYKALDNRPKLKETAWRVFLRRRNATAFKRLVSLLGEERRAQLLDAETAKIFATPGPNYDDISFLLEAGRIDDAEKYILGHAERLDGDLYTHLLNYAAVMEEHKRWLASVVLHRALLESILARAITKYYPYGAKYLVHLNLLGELVKDWRGVLPHAEYFKELETAHARKVSFWEKYRRRV